MRWLQGGAYDEGEEVSGEHAADEAFPGLLRRELDEGRLAEEDAEDVGEDVVADHAELGEHEPEDPLVDVVAYERRHAEHQDQGQH